MPWGIAAAAVVGAYSANQQSKAAKEAARTQAGSASESSQVQWNMFNQSRRDAEPWRQAGLVGLNEYMSLLGLPTNTLGNNGTSTQWSLVDEDANGIPMPNERLYATDAEYRRAWDETAAQHRRMWKGEGYWYGSDNDWIRNGVNSRLPAGYMERLQQRVPANTPQTQQQSQQAAFDRFRAQPGYQFGLTEGVRARDASASAAGGLFSGKAALELTRYGQNYADQQGFQPYMNRLAALSGIGQSQTQQNAQLGANVAQNIGQNHLYAGQARASGLINSQNAWSNYTNQLVGMAGQYYGKNG